jgi:hypothetical protein
VYAIVLGITVLNVESYKESANILKNTALADTLYAYVVDNKVDSNATKLALVLPTSVDV